MTADLTDTEKQSITEIPHPSLPEGSSIYGGTKVFPDYQAEDGEVYFTLVHGIAHESSVSFVAILQATRALRKGFESAIYFYGPGATELPGHPGLPDHRRLRVPGRAEHQRLAEDVHQRGRQGLLLPVRPVAARRARGRPDRGVIPTHPLDVQDALIHYTRKGAIINSTYKF